MQITFYSNAAASDQASNSVNVFFQNAALQQQLNYGSLITTVPRINVLHDRFDYPSAARIVDDLPHDHVRALHILELASARPERASELIQENQYIESLQTVSPDDSPIMLSMAMRALQNIACGLWHHDPIRALNFVHQATTNDFLTDGVDKDNHHHAIDPTSLSMIFTAYNTHATHAHVRDMFHPDDLKSMLEIGHNLMHKHAQVLHEKQIAPACPAEEAAKEWLINFNKYKIAPSRQLNIDQAFVEPVIERFDAVGLSYLIPTFLQHQSQDSLIALIHKGNMHAHAFATSNLYVIGNHINSNDALLQAAVASGNPMAHLICARIILRDKRQKSYPEVKPLIEVAHMDPSLSLAAQWTTLEANLRTLDHPEKGKIDPFIEKLQLFIQSAHKQQSPLEQLAHIYIAHQLKIKANNFLSDKRLKKIVPKLHEKAALHERKAATNNSYIQLRIDLEKILFTLKVTSHLFYTALDKIEEFIAREGNLHSAAEIVELQTIGAFATDILARIEQSNKDDYLKIVHRSFKYHIHDITFKRMIAQTVANYLAMGAADTAENFVYNLECNTDKKLKLFSKCKALIAQETNNLAEAFHFYIQGALLGSRRCLRNIADSLSVMPSDEHIAQALACVTEIDPDNKLAETFLIKSVIAAKIHNYPLATNHLLKALNIAEINKQKSTAIHATFGIPLHDIAGNLGRKPNIHNILASLETISTSIVSKNTSAKLKPMHSMPTMHIASNSTANVFVTHESEIPSSLIESLRTTEKLFFCLSAQLQKIDAESLREIMSCSTDKNCSLLIQSEAFIALAAQTSGSGKTMWLRKAVACNPTPRTHYLLAKHLETTDQEEALTMYANIVENAPISNEATPNYYIDRAFNKIAATRRDEWLPMIEKYEQFLKEVRKRTIHA